MSANVNYLSIIDVIGIIANLSVNYRSLARRLFPDVVLEVVQRRSRRFAFSCFTRSRVIKVNLRILRQAPVLCE